MLLMLCGMIISEKPFYKAVSSNTREVPQKLAKLTLVCKLLRTSHRRVCHNLLSNDKSFAHFIRT